MKIKVLGWYNHGNIGDEAFKLAFPLLFKDHELEFVESIEDDDTPDMVILGGGDVFYPSFTKYIKKLPPSTRKIAASVTLTKQSDLAALPMFEQVYVRDYRSSLIASNAGFYTTYAPDFTFMLEPKRELGREWLQEQFNKSGHQLYEKVVVCVISNYLANAKLDMLARDLTTFMKLSQDIAKVADSTEASFVFLPFSTKPPWDDRVSNSWTADRCKFYGKNYVVWEPIDVQTTLNVVAAADAVVSSRLHSSVFSTISGVPFIDITHHSKNMGFIETLEKTDWSNNFWEFDLKAFRNLLNLFLANQLPNPDLNKFTRLAKEHLRNEIVL